ncbi:MAG: glucosaminidase domain-containing protein [Bacteroidota bacterium]
MKVVPSILSLFLTLSVFAQQKPEVISYIKQFRHIAIDEMVRTRIPASITMAQGLLESGFGKSPLSRQANNHFGIKCKSEWTGKKFFQDDDEAQECFRVYEHAEASYVDHSDFLLTRYRYATLFQLPPTDYKAWAIGLKEVGYATNPKYAGILTTFIETYNLHELDLIALAQIEEKEKLILLCESVEPSAIKTEPVPTATKSKHVEVQLLKSNGPVAVSGGREEFIVNGVRAVKAVGNEDPFKIAFDYNIDYSFVLNFNDLNKGEQFKDGEFIFLHAKKNAGEEPTYKVRSGECMRDVSQRLGIKIKDLYAKNLMKPNEQVYAGEILNLQNTKTQPPRTLSYYEFLKTQGQISRSSQYQVQQTDTLYSIAKKFNTTIEQLKVLNNLESTDLKPGQTLVVSR